MRVLLKFLTVVPIRISNESDPRTHPPPYIRHRQSNYKQQSARSVVSSLFCMALVASSIRLKILRRPAKTKRSAKWAVWALQCLSSLKRRRRFATICVTSLSSWLWKTRSKQFLRLPHLALSFLLFNLETSIKTRSIQADTVYWRRSIAIRWQNQTERETFFVFARAAIIIAFQSLLKFSSGPLLFSKQRLWNKTPMQLKRIKFELNKCLTINIYKSGFRNKYAQFGWNLLNLMNVA